MLEDTVRQWIGQQGLGEVAHAQPQTGGSINSVYRVTMQSGERVILKWHRQAPTNFFAAEALGLTALNEAGSKVPAVIAVAAQMLLMEDLGTSRPTPLFWPQLAQMLANQHRQSSSRFGFPQDNFIGLTEQRNDWTISGVAFFAERRIRFQTKMARDAGLLSTQDSKRLDTLANRLNEWVPEQPAVLLHGDLWRGNVHCTDSGHPALIDPACYYGWAEADLAMTTLFGELPKAFYDEYEAASCIAPDWRSRAPLYNLYHLLNHLNLFGGSYLGSVRSIAQRYA